MSDGSEKRPLTKMLWSISIKTRTFASVDTLNNCVQMRNFISITLSFVKSHTPVNKTTPTEN